VTAVNIKVRLGDDTIADFTIDDSGFWQALVKRSQHADVPVSFIVDGEFE